MNFDKDIAALESIFLKETNQYHNSASLQGKPWYGIGLEDSGEETQKDSSNKKGIISRILIAIRDFITRIIKRIKAFFGGNNAGKAKTQEEFAANYKGPSSTDSGKANSKVDTANVTKTHNLDKFVDKYLKDPIDNNIQFVRTALIMLLGVPDFNKISVKAALNKVEEKIPDLFEPYVTKAFAREISDDIETWDKKYKGTQVVYLSTNFSKERYLHLLEVTDYLKSKPKNFVSAGVELQKEWANSAFDKLSKDTTTMLVSFLDKDFQSDFKWVVKGAEQHLQKKFNNY